MTQEEKKLLLRDLSARLPYKVKVLVPELRKDIANLIGVDDTSYVVKYGESIVCCRFENEIKPYLRPMSSMTEEEREEWADLFMKPICELEQYTDEQEAQDMAPILYGKSHSISVG